MKLIKKFSSPNVLNGIQAEKKKTNHLRILTFFLVIYGLKAGQKLINYLIRVLFLAYILYFLARNMIIIFTQKLFPVLLLATQKIVSLICYLIVIKNLHLLHDTIKFIEQNTSLCDLRKFRKISLLYTFLFIMSICLEVLENSSTEGVKILLRVSFDYVGTIKYYHYIILSIDSIVYVIIVNGWLIVQMLIVVMLHTGTSQIMINYVSKFRGVYPENTIKNLQELTRTRDSFISIKNQINDLTHILPFLWFSEFFFETSYRLIESYNKTKWDYYEYMSNWKGLIILFGLLLILVIFLDSVAVIDSKINKEIWSILKTNGDVASKIDLEMVKIKIMLDISNNPVAAPSAWNMFTLNRVTLLNFLAVVIPFAVLSKDLVKIRSQTECINLYENSTETNITLFEK